MVRNIILKKKEEEEGDDVSKGSNIIKNDLQRFEVSFFARSVCRNRVVVCAPFAGDPSSSFL
jgi:hypothetical protein